MTLKDDPLVLLGWSCPYCGAPTKLVDDFQIYGRSYGTKCYICEPCGAWVGCHKNSDKALGRVANKELRQLKHQAHEAFDPLWKEGYLPRTAAYEVLSTAFQLPKEQTHIGMFDEELCRKVIRLSNIILKYVRQMAKQIEAGKFLVIECTAGELMDAVGSDICICDWCDRPCLPSDKGCYIAVLNHWYCKKCYEEWLARAEWYPEDADVERRNFNFYAPRLGVKCQ